jgi:CRP-like cAMP-binding protein
MSDDRLIATLGQVDLFAGLSPRVLRRIAESGGVGSYEAGTEVIHAGDPVSGFRVFSHEGVDMHVVLAGSAEVRVNGHTVGTLGAGSYFGELSLIDGKPRSADVLAGPAGMTTFALAKWSFDDILKAHPEVAVPMLRVVAGRLRRAESASD